MCKIPLGCELIKKQFIVSIMHEGVLCDRAFQFLSSMFISEVSMAKRFDSEQIAPLADANFAGRSQLSD